MNEEEDNLSQTVEGQNNQESNEKIIDQENEDSHNKLNQEQGVKDSQQNKNISEGDDLMSKLNEEAAKIDTQVNKDNLKMLTKYANLSEKELQVLIKEKNTSLLTLNEEKEASKKELNKIIKSLNEIIATNAEVLYHKEPDPFVMKQLERVIEIRKKDLQMSKRTNQTFKTQYDVISNKANTKLSVERINGIELKIDVIKKENADLIRKTRDIRNKNSIQSKELEICSDNKVHPKKILSYTNEIKSLSSKKHEYHIKLSSNRKSLSNTLKELKKLEDLYYSFLSEETTETIAKRISEWIAMIKSDLEGTEDEILIRAEQCSSKVLVAMERERKRNKDIQTVLPMVNIGTRARSSSPNTKDHLSLQKNIGTINLKETQAYKGIFNKFVYLKPKGKLPHYMTNSSQGKREKEEIKNENIDTTEIIEYDYDNTSNSDYRELLNKKELYVDINQRTEKSIKELEKMSDKKLKDISGTIESNARRLNSLQQQNNFLQLEITNLTKILSLNLEQSRIRKEINHNESKMYKMNPLQHTSNDASMTNNDLSQEFNYLKDEEEKKRSFQPTSSNIIEEENEHNPKQQRINEMDHVESNKHMKFPDISNVEKIDDDGLMDRDKRLMEIKNKYITKEKDDEEEEEEKTDIKKESKGKIKENDTNLKQDEEQEGDKEKKIINEEEAQEEKQLNDPSNAQEHEEDQEQEPEGEGEENEDGSNNEKEQQLHDDEEGGVGEEKEEQQE